MVVGGDAAALRSLPEIGPKSPRTARVRKNEVAVFLEIDEATPKLLGWTAADMVGLRSLDFIHPEDQDRAIESNLRDRRPRERSAPLDRPSRSGRQPPPWGVWFGAGARAELPGRGSASPTPRSRCRASAATGSKQPASRDTDRKSTRLNSSHANI